MPSGEADNKTGLVSRPLMPDGGDATQETRTALVIAHPGHELCVYGWTARLRPRVFVITDGSAHSQKSRIEHTQRNLDRLGAAPGSFYGRFTDAAIYRGLLDHDFDLFARLAVELADTIVKEELTCVVGDASEGYNPTHDACRLVVNAAVEMARAQSAREIANLEFLIASRPNGRVNIGTRMELDDCTFEEKLNAARNYPGLKRDIDALIEKYSEHAFRTEYLYPTFDGHAQSLNHPKPFYEEHGERRVREGYYDQVIRYYEHLLPLARNLLGEK